MSQHQNNLPPQPQPGMAPGQQQAYANGPQMPPPLSIPQNAGQAPAAMGSPMGGNGMGSPSSAGPRRAAPEPNKRALYVGGLDPRVTEDVLKQIFETTGHVQNVKIIPDKNVRPESPVSQTSHYSESSLCEQTCEKINDGMTIPLFLRHEHATCHIHDRLVGPNCSRSHAFILSF